MNGDWPTGIGPDRRNSNLKYWTPEPIWAGVTVYILGGGPSVTPDTINSLQERHVIAVNSAFKSAPWADMLYFMDRTWFVDNRRPIAAFGGVVATLNETAKKQMPEKVRLVWGEKLTHFLPPGGFVRRGKCAGQNAISMAIACGAKRVVLVGFDMRAVNGRTHFHDDYKETRLSVYEEYFIPAFAGWRQDAADVGVEILNATPDSALHEFPLVALSDVLRDFDMRSGIVSLGDFTLTTAGTQIGSVVTNFDGLVALTAQLRLAYGAGGTNVKAYLQTSLDQAVTWIDIACAVFTTASESAVLNFSSLTPKTTQYTPTDGALTDDTSIDGILGDRFRVKLVSTGTYASSTTLSARVLAR